MSAGGHSDNSEQRNQETVLDGRQPVGSRNPLRAYNFHKKRDIENGIPFREFELREESARKPTPRSQNWKKQQQLKQASKGKTPDQPFCELQSHTAHCVYILVPDDNLESHTPQIVSKKKSEKPTARSQKGKKQQQIKQAAKGKYPNNPFHELPFHSAYCLHSLDSDEACYSLGIRTAVIMVSKKSPGKPTARSQNWKRQQQLKQADEAKASNPDKPFCELQFHTADCLHRLDPDEPCYNLGIRAAGIPVTEKPFRKSRLGSKNWEKQQQSNQAAEGSNPDKPFCEWRSHTADCVHQLDPKKPSFSLGNRTTDIMVTKKSSGKPTARFQNCKKQQQSKQAAESSNPDKPFCELRSHTADCVHRLDSKKPSYSLGNRTADITVTKKSSGKPTARSQNWKKQQQLKQAAEGSNPHQSESTSSAMAINTPFCTLEACTADCWHRLDPDEPCYNLGPHTASIPIFANPYDYHHDESCYYETDLGYDIDW